MSIKGQLNASRDFLMAGMRAAARGSAPNQQAERLMRACLDLVEHLARQSENVTTSEVETTLGVMTRAAGTGRSSRDATPVTLRTSRRS